MFGYTFLNRGGTTYSFRVSGRGDGVLYSTSYGSTTSTSGSTYSCPRPTPTPVPPPPTPVLEVSATSQTSITLRWEARAGVNYTLQYSSDGGNTWHSAGNSIAGRDGKVSKEVTLACGTAYTFRARGRGTGSPFSTAYSAWSSSESGRTTGCDPPQPIMNAIGATTQTSITVSWTLPPGSGAVASYKLERSADNDNTTWPQPNNDNFPNYDGHVIEGITETMQEVTGLTCGVTYYFRVSAKGGGSTTYADTHGPTSDPPASGSTLPCLTPPPAPSNVSASIIVGTGANTYGVDLLWGLLPRAASFKVERSDDNGVTWPQPNDPGYDGHVAEGITGTLHSVTGLVCDNDYVFRISALGDGTKYLAVYGPTTLVTRYVSIAGQSASSDVDDFPCTTPTLSVIPLSVSPHLGRRVRIEWEYRMGSRYFPEYRPIQEDGTEAGWKNLYINGTVGEFIVLDFDDDTDLGGFFNEKEGFGFRVKASLGGQETDYREIILIDTPILRTEVDSSGTVKLTWTDIDTVLGGNGLYTVGAYTAHVRKFGESPADVPHIAGNVPHTSRYWHPTQFVESKVYPVDADTLDDPNTMDISGLAANEVYAVQLVAAVTKKGNAIPTAVFAVRDSYVWTSHRAVTDGNRVASFPLEARLKKDAQGNFTYAYHICEDTFTFTTKWSEWEKLIVHAMGQWQLATDNLITMSYLEDMDCANYSDVFTDVAAEIIASGHTPDILHVRNFVTGLSYYGNFTEEDKAKNEIILVDTGALLFNDAIQSAATFPELAREIGLSLCVFGNAFGCAISGGQTRDILLNYDKFTSDALAIPGGAGSDPEPPDRGDAPFNKCAHHNTRNADNAYLTVVHEGGHVVGIGGANDRDPMDPKESEHNGHPNYRLLNSIVNKRDRAGCTPNPLDIMAIFAIYQAR
ncbi:MAG: fibronectin type III domain-containing protein [Chloroflexota bacterium]|nr:fibronectin type III domain-containing protein [Chloroflexota bacterium]